MKSISLDNKEGIIVFSKSKKLVECVFLCKDEEFGGIRTIEECQSWCPNMFCCAKLAEMVKVKEQATCKEADA